MPHDIYTTEAFIISTRHVGESSQYILLFTEMMGTVWVMARGIRKGNAKLRSQTDLYSHVRVTLVRGIYSWRLIEVSHISDCSFLQMNFIARRSVARMFLMLHRFVGVEIRHQKLFLDVREVYLHVRPKSYIAQHARLLDIYVAYTILEQLGYLTHMSIAQSHEIRAREASVSLDIQQALRYISVREGAITSRINRAIYASGL